MLVGKHSLLFLLWFTIPIYLCADIKSTTGTIKFNVNSDSNTEMTLNETGLGIGITPSTNLHVNGNAIVTQSLGIGISPSSNLHLNGMMSHSFGLVSTDTNLNLHSIYLADSSTDNLTLTLPDAEEVSGRVIHVKKMTNSHQVTILTDDLTSIDDQLAIVLDSGTSTLPSVQLMSADNQWYIMDITGNANANNANESFEDGDFTDQFANASSISSRSVDPNIGVGSSYAIDMNSDGSLATPSSNINIATKTYFSLMGKFQVFNTHTNSGALSVGWETTGDTFNPYTGPGQSNMATAGLALTGGNTFSLFAFYRHSGMHLGDSLTGDSYTFTEDRWYRMSGTVEFDGTSVFTWDMNVDEYDTTGSNILNESVLSGSTTYTFNIGTQGRFVFQTNRDRGFEIIDNLIFQAIE